MTKRAETCRCQWCGRDLGDPAPTGRPRRFCRDACRQRAYELRRRRAEGALRSDEVPIEVGQFELVRDGLYELTAALEDVDGDLADARAAAAELTDAYRAAFEHLYRVAGRLRGIELGAHGA